MNRKRALTVAIPLVAALMNAPSLLGQSPKPKFEVASIRRCDAAQPMRGLSTSPGRLTVGCGMSLSNLIVQVYTPRDANGRRISPPLLVQIEGGPGWLNSDRYEINAKADDAAPQQTMRGPMLQALLEDRFKLKLRRETRDVPAWALTLAKGDAKLRQLEERSCTPLDPTKPFDPAKPPEPSRKPPCKGLSMGGNAMKQSFTVDAEGASLDMLTGLYPLALDRPVVNKTGLAGVFSFKLEFAADETTTRMPVPPGAAPPDPAAPSIVTALEEQLGLKLEKSTGPGEFLVIESVQRPSEN